MPRAAMWAVREAGRTVRREAKANAPVLKDKGAVGVRTYQADRKFRAGGGIGPLRGGGTSQPIRGLLKASIAPSKNVKQLGTAAFSLKVGPRGDRVHLYSGKAEARSGFMAAGDRAAQDAMPAIAARAFGRVWQGR